MCVLFALPFPLGRRILLIIQIRHHRRNLPVPRNQCIIIAPLVRIGAVHAALQTAFRAGEVERGGDGSNEGGAPIGGAGEPVSDLQPIDDDNLPF